MKQTIPDRLLALAEADPDREALRILYAEGPDRVLSRAELVQVARRAAGHLRDRGVGSDDLCVIVQQDTLFLAATFFGAAFLDGIPSILPFATEKLHPDRYADSMGKLLQLATPKVLGTENALLDQIKLLLPDDPAIPVPELYVADADSLLKGPLPDLGETVCHEESIALLQHSSGTTGLQKGVALSHRAIFDQLDAYSAALDFTEDDVIVSWLPLYHDMGLIAGFLMPLLTGGRLVILSPFDWVRAPHTLFRAISEHRGTFCWLPNFAYNHCAQKIREEDLAGLDLSSIRAFVNCSEPAYASSHEAFAARFAPYGVTPEMLTVSYAMAETVFAVTQSAVGRMARVETVSELGLTERWMAEPAEPGSALSRRMVSCGPPIGGMSVRVLDPERNPLGERQVGELALKSDYMLTGYYHRPDVTEEAFHEGWYLTGDIGYVADGEVYVMGRKKDLIIVGGKNIHPTDIEALANTVEGVYPGRVVAFGIPDESRGTEDLGIVAEIRDGNLDGKQIAAAIRRLIASHTDVAARFVEVVPRGWLIKTSSGKSARAANRDKFLAMKGLK